MPKTSSSQPVLPPSRVPFGLEAHTRRKSKPPAALTGRYHRSSSINLAQGLLAKLSIAEVTNILTPIYIEPSPNTTVKTQPSDDRVFTAPVYQPVFAPSLPASPTTSIPPALSYSPTSTAAFPSRDPSPASSDRSASSIRHEWGTPPSSTTSESSHSDSDYCACPHPPQFLNRSQNTLRSSRRVGKHESYRTEPDSRSRLMMFGTRWGATQLAGQTRNIE